MDCDRNNDDDHTDKEEEEEGKRDPHCSSSGASYAPIPAHDDADYASDEGVGREALGEEEAPSSPSARRPSSLGSRTAKLSVSPSSDAADDNGNSDAAATASITSLSKCDRDVLLDEPFAASSSVIAKPPLGTSSTKNRAEERGDAKRQAAEAAAGNGQELDRESSEEHAALFLLSRSFFGLGGRVGAGAQTSAIEERRQRSTATAGEECRRS